MRRLARWMRTGASASVLGRWRSTSSTTHEEVLLDADARSKAYLVLDESDEESAHVWHVRQIFHDAEGDSDFAIAADVDLDATQAGDGVVFANYRVGFAEGLGE